jgi:hypothetical protein
MKDWQKFRTFKERGEWVELQFMAEALQKGTSTNKRRHLPERSRLSDQAKASPAQSRSDLAT